MRIDASQTTIGNISLTNEEKQKLVEYMRKKRLSKISENNKEEDYPDLENLLEIMVEDLTTKTNRLESREIFSDYIFAYAMMNLEDGLDEEEKNKFLTLINEEEYLESLVDLLILPENMYKFYTGLIFGYTKLAYKLKVEPDESITSFLEILNFLKQ